MSDFNNDLTGFLVSWVKQISGYVFILQGIECKNLSAGGVPESWGGHLPLPIRALVTNHRSTQLRSWAAR